MPRPRKLSPEILEAAFQGLEAQRQRVESQIADVRRMLGGSTEAPAQTAPEASPRRKLSRAAKARIAAAQRKRWRAYHKAQETPAQAKETRTEARKATAPEAPKRKWQMSAEGRKRIIEATKKRWAEFRKVQRQAAATKAAPKKLAAKKVAAKKAPVKTAAKKAVKRAGAKKQQTAAVAAPRQVVAPVAAAE